ncbi:hypothetical protein ACOMHN_014635 [Nucella lapillus]
MGVFIEIVNLRAVGGGKGAEAAAVQQKQNHGEDGETSLAFFRKTTLANKIGSVLFVVAFILFLISLVVPGHWVYEEDVEDESIVRGLSVWDLGFPTCLGNRGTTNGSLFFRCDTMPGYGLEAKKAGVALMFMGTVTQLLACVLIVVRSRRGQGGCPSMDIFVPETAAGVASSVSFTGLLLYLRFTHIAVNIDIGPGVILHCVGIFLAYVGLVITALHQIAAIRPKRRQRTEE